METLTQTTQSARLSSAKQSHNNVYKPQHHIRIVTATSLFDGHDVAINMMRRMMQNTRCEVIHLGHNRSVHEVVNTAIQEDAQAIAVTSYQGGHNEYFKYMYDLLHKHKAGHIKIFGGGGGVILPEEIKALMDYGITRIYSPEDGRKMGLQGMINDLVEKSDYPLGRKLKDEVKMLNAQNPAAVARLISAAENFSEVHPQMLHTVHQRADLAETPVVGVTGTGGSGKSSIVDELIRRFLQDTQEQRVAILSVDPSKLKTGGALLGDRIRMNAIDHARVFMRSLATRASNRSLSQYVGDALAILKAARYDFIILETSGIGQGDMEIIDHSDVTLYVMTPEYGAASQLEKINMLDFADLVALNKVDKQGGKDALRDVKKQYQRNHQLWDESPEDMPVFGTVAAQFNNEGINQLYGELARRISKKMRVGWSSGFEGTGHKSAEALRAIPASRVRYLSDIAEQNRKHRAWVAEQSDIAQQLYALHQTIVLWQSASTPKEKRTLSALQARYKQIARRLDPANRTLLKEWDQRVKDYKAPSFTFKVRKKEVSVNTHTTSLAQSAIPKVSLPRYRAWGDLLRWMLLENLPGEFPYTAGVYPFKREEEDPTRMFAGEGDPERTNHRFHYVSSGIPAKRLSTAFDSVTLYGQNPHKRPDIYGKIGNAGVSVCCLDDMKKLYSGFHLASPNTSVSMTINGPAPILLAYFMNAAIDQQCELYIHQHGLVEQVEAKIKEVYREKGLRRPVYKKVLPTSNDGLGLLLLGTTGDQVLDPRIYEKIKAETMSKVRGTVQADILKEDQAQNTCIFSIEFAMQLMGDVQQYFIDRKVKNFYSVSISGYHIAEAGANPITQLAFTLANGFTYVEYYLSRGMHIDDFAPNLSFFFSNGLDPEYAVIGRVARRIWARTMRYKYKANTRSQMLKYHIQTSGRSLHEQEIDFNDIRTTLQALYAIYDNCNSLHTNAYDEAVTTPTEHSVRRAMAIQLIINKELGLARNENPLQGSFIIEELTDLVEEAVLLEFDRITERGGVPGAMETMYQRGKIQEESMHYEKLKHTGEHPIIGVNTFINKKGAPQVAEQEVMRATEQEKEGQILTVERLHRFQKERAEVALKRIQKRALAGENIFEDLMEATKVCSLGQLTNALFEVGGEYSRNM